MKWSDEFATGVERIDEQHKMLFKMAEDFRAAFEEGTGERVYGDVLRTLHHYARVHFGFEEGVMEKYHCPAALHNREAHTRFVEVLSTYQERYAEHGFRRDDALGLVDTLDRWLANHISKLDVQLKGCVPK
jgi:hemerythrin